MDKYLFILICWISTTNAAPESHSGPRDFSDGVVMAHVIGSGALNFLYYFYVLEIECENKDKEFWKYLDRDFRMCVNRTALPTKTSQMPYGSIEKACASWKLYRTCHEVFRDDLDDCGISNKNSVKKGTDAFKFTDAYSKYICKDLDESEIHLVDRASKKHGIASGVFHCFDKIQERIKQCILKDEFTFGSSFCSKFTTVRDCFAEYYGDDNCNDDDTITYMDNLFKSMFDTLDCPDDDDGWLSKLSPIASKSSKPSKLPSSY